MESRSLCYELGKHNEMMAFSHHVNTSSCFPMDNIHVEEANYGFHGYGELQLLINNTYNANTTGDLEMSHPNELPNKDNAHNTHSLCSFSSSSSAESVSSAKKRKRYNCKNSDPQHKKHCNMQEEKPAPSRGKSPASDPQSLYARKRRDKINQRLRILQNLIPNGNKLDLTSMLDQAIDYVKFMQLQIEVLSSDKSWMYAPIMFNNSPPLQTCIIPECKQLTSSSD